MSRIDETFKTLCENILNKGTEYENKRRGVKRKQIPFYSLVHSFENGFPALSSKKLYWKGVVGELLWFLKGDTDVQYLNENGITFWNQDAYNWHVKKAKELNFTPLSFHEFEEQGSGSVGKNYSHQWRNYNGNTDQIKNLIEGMFADIYGSRLKVSAWNASELNETALPPCHDGFQIIGDKTSTGEDGFWLSWNQRSVDTYLGLPLNTASYALLAKILEYITGYKAMGIEGSLKCVHFYDNQYEAIAELLTRDTTLHQNCEIELVDMPKFDIENIDAFFNELSIKNFKLVNYTYDENIKVEMLAPKSI